MKSRKALHEFLTGLKIQGWSLALPSTHKKFHNEVYGKKACIYFQWPDRETRAKGESALTGAGFKVDSYWPESAISEVVVSYFKGWHWNE